MASTSGIMAAMTRYLIHLGVLLMTYRLKGSVFFHLVWFLLEDSSSIQSKIFGKSSSSAP